MAAGASRADLEQRARRAERRARAARRELLKARAAVSGAVVELEDRAARFGSSAAQPLGIELAPGSRHTRTNRLRLESLSGGLNMAAELLRDVALKAVR